MTFDARVVRHQGPRADGHVVAEVGEWLNDRQFAHLAVGADDDVARDDGGLVHETRQGVTQRLRLQKNARARTVVVQVADSHE